MSGDIYFNIFRFNEELSNFLPPRNNILRKIVYWYWWATVPIISPLLLLAVFIYYLYDAVSSPNQYSAWQPDLVSQFVAQKLS